MYALHAMLGVVDGRTDEASIECADLDDAIGRIRELVAARPDFRAITLLHAEDLPLTLQGASTRPEGGLG